MKLAVRSALMWLCFLVLAFVNGAFREVVMIGHFGTPQPQATQLSCLTGILLWTSLLRICWRWLDVQKWSQALSIGFSWFFATMLFETFVLNHDLSWTAVLHTYDASQGEYWGLVLLWVGLMPVVGFAMVRSRRWINTWGASIEEHLLAFHGEEFLREPRTASTHAITIQVPPEKVWPWLVQIGQGRGGFYSYSWLENLVGSRIQNVDRIIPELQDLKKGDLILLHPKAPPLKVTVLEENRVLALEGWIFSLRPIGHNHTRLISRIYTENKPEMGRTFNWFMKSALFDFAHFLMSRKQLLKIKELAEG